MGLTNIVEEPSHERYTRDHPLFEDKLKIWSKVAELPDIVSKGYIAEAEKNLAIAEYNEWVENNAEEMVMNLIDVRGIREGEG